jgi:hypothetical protein
MLTTDVQLLHFVFGRIPSQNARDTRRRFFIPKKITLERVSMYRYSQQHAFMHAMQTYSGLEAFRYAVARRRVMADRRRERARVAQAILIAHTNRRRQLVKDAIEVVQLPQTYLQIQVHCIRFVHIMRPTTHEHEEFLLSVLIERVCWVYYLETHTDFGDRVKQRIELMGYYPGLQSDIEDEFTRPLSWPWLE